MNIKPEKPAKPKVYPSRANQRSVHVPQPCWDALKREAARENFSTISRLLIMWANQVIEDEGD